MRNAQYLVVPVLVGSTFLAGCGTDSTNNAGAAVVSPGAATSSSGPTANACPTENTRSFAKTRFVADVGLAAGTFHRYIYKPYKAGTFKGGADGRKTALVKAVATAALDAKLISNATKNAKANPTLCRTLATSLSRLSTRLDGLDGEITSGNLAAIASVETLIQQVLKDSKSAGLPVTETSK